MRRQVWIFTVWLAYMSLISTPVTPLLDETTYTDLTCSADMDDAGVDPSAIQADLTGPDNNIAFSYLCENFKYMFKCCGKIKEWRFIPAKEGTIQFQVWRRISTSSYELIGENYCQIVAANLNTLTSCLVNDYDKILVRKGDFIGWHNQGNETLAYKTAAHFSDSTLENLFRRKNAGDLYPGDTYDWSGVEAYNDRLYPVQAIYEESQNPTISASDMNVPDYINSGDTVGRITYEDTDYMDNSSLVVVSTQTSAYYTTDLPSGYVTASNSFRPRNDNLRYFVYDLCYKTATVSHAITVQETTLVTDTLAATFTISEAVTTQTLLHTITVTDPVDDWYCYSKLADWPTSYPFMLKAITTTSYGFYVVEDARLDYDSKSDYTLPVICLENKVTATATVSVDIQLYVTENQPPTITNLYASVAVNAETAFIGDSVFTVMATDPESDIVTFTMTCASNGTADTTSFTMLANGDVVVKKFLTLTIMYQFDCAVTATDSDGNTDSNNLHIYITHTNDLISFLNKPTNRLEVMENTPIGRSLYNYEYAIVDSDSVYTKTWSFKVVQNRATRFVAIDSETGELSTAFSVIDAEDEGVDKSRRADVIVSNTKTYISNPFILQVINENEAPWFEENYFTIEADEGYDGVEITDGTLFSFYDEDLDDAENVYEDHFFSLDCDNVTNTQRFYITRETGAIRYQGAYDIDTSGTPSQLECTVTVTDRYGLYDSATLHINIRHVNDYSPVLTHSDYTFYLASNTVVGTYVGTVSAVDHDSSDDYDSEITYTLDHTAVGGTIVLAVNNDGALYTANSLETYIGSTLNIDVLASNYGVHSGTALITINVPATTITTTTTTDRNKDFYEDQWSYYWLLATLFGLTLILVAITVVCFRICRLTRIGPYCYQCCMKGICCRPPPDPPRGFGDRGYDLASFGHRHHFADEDVEVDGWLLTKREAKNKKSKTRVGTDGRYGTPNSGYDWSSDVRPEPIYEMFKVGPSSNIVPKAANYLDPYTSTRKIPRSERNAPMNRP